MKPTFITCQKCGKRLIERKRNGIWYFLFGKPAKNSDNFIPVEIYIQGNLRIKCIRRTCGHWQDLSYFPNVFETEEKKDIQSENSEQIVQGSKQEKAKKNE